MMQLEQCLRLLQHSARQGATCRPSGGLHPAAALAAILGRALSSNGGGGSSSSPPAASSSGSSSGSAGGGPPPWRPGQRLRVAVGVSGGVDSAVAAMLLQQQGHEVVGVFMRNWDEGEETGNQNCSVERDARDAAAVCRQLGVPLHEADFVSKYWNQVFSQFVADCGRGLTPNPDLACNRHIKFDALLAFARDKLGADAVATGHYARLRWPSEAAAAAAAAAATVAPRGEGALPARACGLAGLDAAAASEGDALGPQLLRGADRHKDQTYFLASVERSSLARVLFPLGGMPKPAVRALAAEAGLAPASRRSSAGICFIGRRDFGDFLSQYAPPTPGRYVDVDGGADLGPCPNLLALTHGQRPGLGGLPGKTYVAGKDVVAGVAYVARGHDHAALLCRAALLRAPHWLSGRHAAALAGCGWLACEYKARYGQQPAPCVLVHAAAPPPAEAVAAAAALAVGAGTPLDAAALTSLAAGFQPSAYCRLRPEDAGAGPGYLVALFPAPAAAITPGQAFVLYDSELCLGSAPIAQPGMSLHEERKAAGRTAAAAVLAAAA